MIDIKTGKHFPDATKTMTRRDALKGGLAAILAAGVAPSLCGSITRGIGYRNLAGRMAMFSGGGKPHQYLAYLNIGSGQYMDTLWHPTIFPMTVECEMRYRGVFHQYDCFIGVGRNTGTPAFLFRRINNNNTLQVYQGSLQNSFNAPAIDTFFHFKSYYADNTGKFTIDNVEYVCVDSRSESYLNDHSMLLGAWYVQSRIQFDTSDMDLKYFICRDGSGMLVHDFRPVMRNEDGRCCFYDEITGLYHYNEGTGGDFSPPT